MASSYLQNPHTKAGTQSPGWETRQAPEARLQEVAAQHRVFAQVLEATSRHADLLARLQTLGQPSSRGEMNSWER